MVRRWFYRAGYFAVFFIMWVPLSSRAESEKPRLNVDQLVEEALRQNPEILAAKKKWEVYKERIPQA